eukprot:g1945.t1
MDEASTGEAGKRTRSPSAANLTGANPGIEEEGIASQKPKLEPMEMERGNDEERVGQVDEPYEMGLKDKFLVKWLKLNLSSKQLGAIDALQALYAMVLIASSMAGDRDDFAFYTDPNGSDFG